jgi:gliding motility-associated-like protein
VNFKPKVSFDAPDSACARTNIDFENTGTSGDKWSYSWDFGAGARPSNSTAENPQDINYKYGKRKTVTFTITDGTCTNTDTDFVYIDTLPKADAGADTTICAERQAELGTPAVSGYSYLWKPASTLDDSSKAQPIASPEATFTDYRLTVTDENTGCKNKDTVLVSMLTSMMADAGPDREICYGDTVQIGTAPLEGQTYRWEANGDTSMTDPMSFISDSTAASPYVRPSKTTEYTVYVTDTSASQCDAITDQVTVTVHPLPDVDIGEDSIAITRGAEAPLMATGGVQYLWTPREGLSNSSIQDPVAAPDSSTTYTVEVTDVNQCVNWDSIHIEVNEPKFFVPSAFTPNQDGKNDVFRVRSRGFEEFELLIFNRWGEQLFQTSNPNATWNGRKLGTNQKVPEGAYVYVIKGEVTNGETIKEKGMVNLIR